MGTYVEYILCPPEGPLSQIEAAIHGFADWYVGDFAEDADPQVLALITAIKDHGTITLADLAPERDATLDRLVGEFYGHYCDCAGEPRVPEVHTSMLRVQRYHQLHEEMAAMLAPAVSDLWRYIYSGRPVAPANRTRPYISDDGASWVAWWSLTEIRALRAGLPAPDFVGSDYTEFVLPAVQEALAQADQLRCGLVVTAF